MSPTASTSPMASMTLPSLTSASTCSPMSVSRTSQIVLPSTERLRSVGMEARRILDDFLPSVEVVPTLIVDTVSEPVAGEGKDTVCRNERVGAR